MTRYDCSRSQGEVSRGTLACEQALLFGRAKRVSRERASEGRSREGPSLVRSREARPNRRACSYAKGTLLSSERGEAVALFQAPR